MMRSFSIYIAAVLLVVPSAIMLAQQSRSHTVTVRFQQQNEVRIDHTGKGDETSGLSQNRNAKAFQNILHALNWNLNPSMKKITVSTNPASEGWGLRVRAVDCNGGISSGRIMLTSSDRNLVTEIDKQDGGCGLEYTFEEQSLKRGGMGDQPVFYTITDAF